MAYVGKNNNNSYGLSVDSLVVRNSVDFPYGSIALTSLSGQVDTVNQLEGIFVDISANETIYGIKTFYQNTIFNNSVMLNNSNNLIMSLSGIVYTNTINSISGIITISGGISTSIVKCTSLITGGSGLTISGNLAASLDLSGSSLTINKMRVYSDGTSFWIYNSTNSYASNYALYQNSTASTVINTGSGSYMNFSINNVPYMNLYPNGVFCCNINNLFNKTLVLYDNNTSDTPSTATNFIGFGVNSHVLRYQVDTISGSHVFYGGSTLLGTLSNNGLVLQKATLYSDGTNLFLYNNSITSWGSSFALFQNSVGNTVINSASGQNIDFKINNSSIMSINTTNLSINKTSIYTDGSSFWLYNNTNTYASSFALYQSNTGYTAINSCQNLDFKINNTLYLQIYNNGVVNVGNNNIMNKILVLYDTSQNETPSTGNGFYGFGVSYLTLRHQVPPFGLHKFYIGSNPENLTISTSGITVSGSIVSNSDISGSSICGFNSGSLTPNKCTIVTVGDSLKTFTTQIGQQTGAIPPLFRNYNVTCSFTNTLSLVNFVLLEISYYIIDIFPRPNTPSAVSYYTSQNEISTNTVSNSPVCIAQYCVTLCGNGTISKKCVSSTSDPLESTFTSSYVGGGTYQPINFTAVNQQQFTINITFPNSNNTTSYSYFCGAYGCSIRVMDSLPNNSNNPVSNNGVLGTFHYFPNSWGNNNNSLCGQAYLSISA